MPSDFSAEQDLTRKIADRILRDLPEMDTEKAANLEIQKEQQKRRNSGGPPKRRKTGKK